MALQIVYVSAMLCTVDSKSPVHGSALKFISYGSVHYFRNRRYNSGNIMNSNQQIILLTKLKFLVQDFRMSSVPLQGVVVKNRGKLTFAILLSFTLTY
jgi:hypothetical protein